MPEVNIQVMDSGPYLVQGGADVKDADGNSYPDGGNTIALCRCGQSSNKPFCDGTHATAGFDAAERAS
jgi:CDGSH-type Zn-finger protein